MDENIHNEDEYFKSAYQRSAEEPSPEVWNKINAALDKRDAAYYRKKFASWRLVACLIMLLFGSTAVYYMFLKAGNRKSNTTINKSSAGNKQTTHAETSLTNSNKTATGKPADSTNTYSFKNEKKIIISFAPLYTNENHSNHYNTDQAFKNRKQDTEQVDNSSITRQLYNQQQHKLPEFVTDSAKQWQQPDKFSTPLSEDLTKQPATNEKLIDSIANNVFAKTSPDELHKKSVTNNLKKDTIKTIQDTTVARQHYAFGKPASYKKSKASFSRYWTITPFASADFTHYKLDNDATDDNNSISPEDKKDIQEREKHEFSYSAGIVAKLHLSKKIGVKSGAVYSNIAIGIQPQTLYASANGNQGVSYKFITSSGYAYVNPNSGIAHVPGDSISSQIAQHHLQYLHIPAMISYTVLHKKRLSLDAAAGVSTNFLLSTTVETEVEDDNNKAFVAIHKLRGLRPAYFSFIADAALQLYISKHINAAFLPSFKYAINPINKNNIVKTFPYSFGIGAGITYRL